MARNGVEDDRIMSVIQHGQQELMSVIVQYSCYIEMIRHGWFNFGSSSRLFENMISQ